MYLILQSDDLLLSSSEATWFIQNRIEVKSISNFLC